MRLERHSGAFVHQFLLEITEMDFAQIRYMEPPDPKRGDFRISVALRQLAFIAEEVEKQDALHQAELDLLLARTAESPQGIIKPLPTIKLDPNHPEGTVTIENGQGQTIGRIVNIGPDVIDAEIVHDDGEPT